MKGPRSALVILTHALARASFSFFQFGVYIVVQIARPQVKGTKVSSVLPTQAISHQERILGLFWGGMGEELLTPVLKQRTPVLPRSQGVASKEFRAHGRLLLAVVPARKVPRETAHCATPPLPCLGGIFYLGGDGVSGRETTHIWTTMDLQVKFP